MSASCEFANVSEKRNQNQPIHSTTSLSSQTRRVLFDMKKLEQLTDVNLVGSDEKKLPVHRAIMASSSRFFRALFTNNFKENHSETVTLSYIPSTILQQIIDFAYIRQVEINSENAEDLFFWADYLDVPRLRDCCAKFLQRNLNPENCLRVWSLAAPRDSKTLKEASWHFILRNFSQLLDEKEPEIMNMETEDFKRLTESDILDVRSERMVWQTVVKWIELKPEERKPLASQLLCNVRTIALTETCLEEFCRDLSSKQYFTDPLVKDTEALSELAAASLKLSHNLQLSSGETLRLMQTKACRPRLPSQILLAVGGWSGGSPTNMIESYDCRTDKWTELPICDPNGPRAYHGLVVLGRKMYMMGGFNGQMYFNSLRCFDTVTKEWKEKGPMHMRRCYVSSVGLRDRIFALGGFDGTIRVSSCECYQPEENQWILVTPMNVQRSDAHAAVIGDKIYVCGGFNGHDCMDSCEVYDLNEDRWRMIRPMGSRRSGLGLTELNGAIYAIGGFNGVNRLVTAERYDPRTDRWDSLSQMEIRRSNFGVETVEGKIYVAGGFNGSGTITNVECYDSRMNAWTKCAKMNINRSALYMCSLNHQPNALDFLGSRDFILQNPLRLAHTGA